MLGSVRGALSNERLYRDKVLLSQGRRLSECVERNMSNAAKRGIVDPVGVKDHITRKRIASEPGRSHVWPAAACRPVRIGKARSRSR